jgi:hypothetical protein
MKYTIRVLGCCIKYPISVSYTFEFYLRRFKRIYSSLSIRSGVYQMAEEVTNLSQIDILNLIVVKASIFNEQVRLINQENAALQRLIQTESITIARQHTINCKLDYLSNLLLSTRATYEYINEDILGINYTSQEK